MIPKKHFERPNRQGRQYWLKRPVKKKKGNKDGNSSLICTLENFQWCVNYKQWLECSSRKSGVAGNILEKSVCGI